MCEPAEWVILMTEAAAEPGKARVFVYGYRRRDDTHGPVARLDKAVSFGSRAEAEARIRQWRGLVRMFGEYVLTPAPLHSPGIPALPGGAGKAR